MAQINRFGGNISRTANFVGMERSALHRKLKTLNVVTTNKAGTRIAKIEDAVQYIEDA
jgi:two-component system nitrogen regulation response regulator NtrX